MVRGSYVQNMNPSRVEVNSDMMCNVVQPQIAEEESQVRQDSREEFEGQLPAEPVAALGGEG